MEQGHCDACRRKWRLTDTDLCPCGETQTMSHIVEFCPLTKLNGGLSRLHSVDEDAVSWLTNYGSWHALREEDCIRQMIYYFPLILKLLSSILSAVLYSFNEWLNDLWDFIAISWTKRNYYVFLIYCFSVSCRCFQSTVKVFRDFYQQMTNPQYSAVTDVYALMFMCDLITFIIVVFGYASFGPSVSSFVLVHVCTA